MKNHYLLSLLTTAVFASSACHQQEQRNAKKDSTHAMTESMDHISKSEVNFVTDAGNCNLKQVAINKLAQQNAQYGRIKEYASRLQTSFAKENETLEKASTNSGVSMPQDMDRSASNDLKDMGDKKGKDFDKAYIKMQIHDQQQHMEALDAAAHNMKDTALKQYAIEYLPIAQKNLAEARVILQDLRKQIRPEEGYDIH
jgi:putative membrane protein